MSHAESIFCQGEENRALWKPCWLHLMRIKEQYESHFNSIRETSKEHFKSHANLICETRKEYHKSCANTIKERKKCTTKAMLIQSVRQKYYKSNANSICETRKVHNESHANSISDLIKEYSSTEKKECSESHTNSIHETRKEHYKSHSDSICETRKNSMKYMPIPTKREQRSLQMPFWYHPQHKKKALWKSCQFHPEDTTR